MIINKVTHKAFIVRGDYDAVKIQLSGDYSRASGDKITMSARTSVDGDLIFQNSGIVDTDNCALIDISADDTNTVATGEYVYDIVLVSASKKKTLIPCATLVIGEEVY